MRRIPALLCALSLLLLSACTSPSQEEGGLRVLATTYPLYLLTSAVARDVEGVTVERMDTGSVSCLHDYALTVNDMKKLDRADLIVRNGAGLEDFLEDALASSHAAAIDCSQDVELLESLDHAHDEEDHDGHDHGHWDPHYWMDPANAIKMTETLKNGLIQADPDHAAAYQANAEQLQAELQAWAEEARALVEAHRPQLADAGLITFHDGFQYFAKALDLPLLCAIEEEAGSEASAKEIVEVSALVRERDIPVIFTEVNGSDATAGAISRETGCRVAQLTMMMDGPDARLENYLDGLMENIQAVIGGFSGQEGAA